MLYEIFNSLKEAHGQDYFISRINDEIVQNLNPRFELRDYQKEALGRFDFYFNGYQKRKSPAQILFHMATGSGKTLIMAANILYLYKLGYRNFIFFVNSVNIIEKTRDNFLNPLSEKYLFAPKIKFGEKEVFIKEGQNFEGVNEDNINIIFTTIQGLHTRLNYPRENALTYEEFENKNIVLISDEAHHLQTLTKSKLTTKEEEEKSSWEYTIMKGIFEKNPKNVLLEFTATIDLGDKNVRKKYEDKIIFQYDLRQYRLDKFSKEIEVLEANLEPIDRALQAIILSQYRRKIAEKYKIRLKPVILCKSKSIKESKENYDQFLKKIKNLKEIDLNEIRSRSKGTYLEKAFNYFIKENITYNNLIKELQEDFSEEKVMLLDSENIDEEKQLKLNSLESPNNEIRIIFSVNMLNEGWDVLNLFDIVKLYDTRDGKWKHGNYYPGNTTMGEAQLIGRGARYFPFQMDRTQDKYKRKFDENLENELRIIETLFYHCFKEPRYIDEIKSTLTDIGILAERYIQMNLFIKEDFKKTFFWKEGIVFKNDRIDEPRQEITGFKRANIEEKYRYDFKTGEIKEEVILDETKSFISSEEIEQGRISYNLSNFGGNLIRTALDKVEFFKFETLKKYFPHLKSIKEFISSSNYLGGVKIEVFGAKNKIKSLTSFEKLEITLNVLQQIEGQVKVKISKYRGNKVFKKEYIKEIFRNTTVKIDRDLKVEEPKIIEYLANKEWFAQTGFYGTSEEENFIKFFDGIVDKLRKKYAEIALLRNEKFIKIYDFDQGRGFEPDFVMLLRKKNGAVITYQVFIEPKGDQFKDNKGKFENSMEGWKQDFLLRLEKQSEIENELIIENENFKLIGLPFYNEKLKEEFEKAFEDNLLS